LRAGGAPARKAAIWLLWSRLVLWSSTCLSCWCFERRAPERESRRLWLAHRASILFCPSAESGEPSCCWSLRAPRIDIEFAVFFREVCREGCREDALCWTSAFILLICTNTPFFCGHWKYRTPLTEPSFLPMPFCRAIPIHSTPGRKFVGPMNFTRPTLPSASSYAWFKKIGSPKQDTPPVCFRVSTACFGCLRFWPGFFFRDL